MIVLRYILLFFFYSTAGWLFESLYRSIGERRIINSGFMTGPLCPIYGSGALIMTVCLYNPFSDRPLLVFVLGMIVCDAVEYVTSLGMEILFNQHWWNYKYEFINIKGRICLKHTLFWGAAAVGFTYIIHPGVHDIIFNKIPNNIVIIIVCCAFAIFIVDYIYTFMRALDVRSMQSKFYSFKQKVSEPINGIIGTIGDATTSFGDKLNEGNAKINESRQELYEQVEKLIAQFEDKLGITEMHKKQKKGRNRLYQNAKIKLNSLKQLEWLKKIRDEFKLD